VRIDVIKGVKIREVGLEGVFSYLAGKIVAHRYVAGLSIWAILGLSLNAHNKQMHCMGDTGIVAKRA
jgi:hypothetical protein